MDIDADIPSRSNGSFWFWQFKEMALSGKPAIK
jgi:hypothetical protein